MNIALALDLPAIFYLSTVSSHSTGMIEER